MKRILLVVLLSVLAVAARAQTGSNYGLGPPPTFLSPAAGDDSYAGANTDWVRRYAVPLTAIPATTGAQVLAPGGVAGAPAVVDLAADFMISGGILNLSNTGVAPGRCVAATVDAHGRVGACGGLVIGDIPAGVAVTLQAISQTTDTAYQGAAVAALGLPSASAINTAIADELTPTQAVSVQNAAATANSGIQTMTALQQATSTVEQTAVQAAITAGQANTSDASLTALGSACGGTGSAAPLILGSGTENITGGAGGFVQFWTQGYPQTIYNNSGGSITVCPPPGTTINGQASTTLANGASLTGSLVGAVQSGSTGTWSGGTNVLTRAGSGVSSVEGATGAVVDYQCTLYSTPGSYAWTAPSWATGPNDRYDVYLVGGGGAGGAGGAVVASTATSGGAGGGAGFYREATGLESVLAATGSPPGTLNVTVGEGGGASGGNGTASSVGGAAQAIYLIASGGGGGGAGGTVAATGGGSGGAFGSATGGTGGNGGGTNGSTSGGSLSSAVPGRGSPGAGAPVGATGLQPGFTDEGATGGSSGGGVDGSRTAYPGGSAARPDNVTAPAGAAIGTAGNLSATGVAADAEGGLYGGGGQGGGAIVTAAPTITALAWASTAGGTVTATVASAATLPYALGASFLFTLSGASPSGYNGTYVATMQSTTTFSYAEATPLAAGTAFGAMAISVAGGPGGPGAGGGGGGVQPTGGAPGGNGGNGAVLICVRHSV